MSNSKQYPVNWLKTPQEMEAAREFIRTCQKEWQEFENKRNLKRKETGKTD